MNKMYKFLYSFFYFLLPFEILKKIIKSLRVTSEIFKNNISYYPKSVTDFENSFCSYFGAKYGLTFCNGTSSIDAALFAIGLQKGDEVIVQSCTFHASIDPIINLGATPIFVDVQNLGSTLNLVDLESKITRKTKAIITVHLFGIPSNVLEIKEISARNKLYLIEDCSHAHGASFNSNPIGTFGDIACFSLQGAKAIAAGEGGVAITNTKTLFTKMSIYGHFGRHNSLFEEDQMKYFHTGLGYKRRAHPLGIVLAKTDLDFLNIYNSRMNKNRKKIINLFKKVNCLEIPEDFMQKLTIGGFFGGTPFLIRSKKLSPQLVLKTFSKYGISISVYPFELHHKMERYTSPDSKQTLPHTEYLKSHLCLLDRRLLIFLPYFTRIFLYKALIELELKSNA